MENKNKIKSQNKKKTKNIIQLSIQKKSPVIINTKKKKTIYIYKYKILVSK